MSDRSGNSRRHFLTLASSGAALALARPGIVHAQQAAPPQPASSAATSTPPRPAALKPEMVSEFVRAGHFDLPRVKEMLAAEPGVLNATWDWGGGDWETALGGAGHMGRKDIAEFLISQGARMDIFVAAMLGQLDVVKAMLMAYPPLLHSRGPHGIPLMAHAKKGGAGAEAVIAHLQSLGLS